MDINFKEINKINDKKKPKTKEKHVGIELECICFLERNQLAWEFFKAGIGQYVNVGTDGSIELDFEREDEGYHPHEVRILSPESKLEEVITKVCEVLDKWGAEVNESCGMHIHLDMRTRDKDIAFHNLTHSQDILYKMNPLERKTNEYSRENSFKEYKDYFKKQKVEEKTYCGKHETYDLCNPYTIYREINYDKYYGINPMSFRTLKTLEVRIHAGTVDSNKIINWAKILVAIVSKSTKIEKEIKDVKDLKDTFKLSDELVGYVKKRMEIFKRNKNKMETR